VQPTTGYTLVIRRIGKNTLVERAHEGRKFVYGELGAVKGEGCSGRRGVERPAGRKEK
jgi:hypothetical protein